jgi:hypothetical protein
MSHSDKQTKNSTSKHTDKTLKNSNHLDKIDTADNSSLKIDIDLEKLSKDASSDLKHLSKENINKILELLKNYVNMDKSFRLKHESLKTLYNAYLELFKKYKTQKNNTTTTNNTTATNTTTQSIVNNSSSNSATGASASNGDEKHTEMLKNIHSEMKETPDIDHDVKNKLCGRLIAIFKSPPIPEYKPLPLLQSSQIQSPDKMLNNISRMVNMSGMQKNLGIRDPKYDEEKINVNELDDAYLQKHNELMTVFKAYQNLYNKVLNYKDQLEKYKNLPTGSSISRCDMEKMIKDQRFVMNMIDKMQDKLVDEKIIDNSEKVLVTPVTSHSENMNMFNNTMREQIKHIIDRNVDVNPSTRNKIENLLSQYKECDSNDKFCNSGKQILLLKKM